MGRKFTWVAIAVFCLLSGIAAWAQMQPDIATHKACSNCGMDRERFNTSRMVVEFSDGTTKAVCSLRCAIDEMGRHQDKAVKSIKVADYNTKKLIDAEKAFWVVGGERPGVMARVGKWAFEKKEDAEVFIKTNGGNLATFKEATAAAREEMGKGRKMMGGKGMPEGMKP
ncbi:MAG TPA: nitrous oxide reductase accessory protein NosL [Syntrophorhabdaceae bacterium]